MKHETVSREDWLKARKALLAEEKAFTKQRDALSAKRRELPWVKIDKTYQFETPAGAKTLADLFENCSQLIVYHFMFGPDWQEGCPSCSFWADNFERIDIHLAHRNTKLVSIAKAPLEKLQAYQSRMGWSVPLYSAQNTDFNEDFGVTFSAEQIETGENIYNYKNGGAHGQEMPGISVFNKSGDRIYHSYSTFGRGLDMMNGAYHYLDLTPKGRDEDELSFTMAWLRRRDQY